MRPDLAAALGLRNALLLSAPFWLAVLWFVGVL